MGYGISSIIFFLLGDTKEAYMTLFLGSIIFSTVSLLVMRNIPRFTPEKEEGNVAEAAKKMLPYLLFTLLTGIGLSAFSPYLQLYILSSDFLHLSPVVYTLVITVIAISAMSSQIYWGKIIERIGNIRAILISGILLSTVPILTIFARSLVLIFPEVILLGLMQSGFTLAAFNELISKSEKRRISGISVYSVVQSLSVALGPILANLIFQMDYMKLDAVFVFCFTVTLAGSLYYSISRTT